MKTALKVIAIATLGSLTLSGCYGQFALTQKVYDWNKSFNDKWVAEGVFLVTGVILPVYGIAAFVDAIVFNSMEFWQGTNPVSNTPAVLSENTRILPGKDGRNAKLTHNNDGSISVSIMEGNAAVGSFVLVREADRVKAVDHKGNVIAWADQAGILHNAN